jgi:uncharacterized protein YlxP (DUF503 family)
MIVGLLQFQIAVDGSTSLKDKRRVVKSLKDRLHREHQVSVAEIDRLDDPVHAVLGLSLTSNDLPHTQSVLDRILDKLQTTPGFVLEDHRKEILTGH